MAEGGGEQRRRDDKTARALINYQIRELLRTLWSFCGGW